MKKTLVVATALVALVAVPAALADKPAPKPKPIAAEKTWVKVGGGKNYGTVVTLKSLGVTVTPLKPASTVSTGLRLPITQGKLILSKTGDVITGVKGSVGHVGGVKLTNGDKSVAVRNVTVVANLVSGSPDASKLTAQIAGKRVDLGTATLGTVTLASGKVTVPLTAISLSQDAATALNTALGTTLTANTSLGTATLTARVVGKGKA